MIAYCIQYVESVLLSQNVKEIYTKPEDATRHKGSRYALILEDNPEQNERDGSKIAYFDDMVNRVRTYHIRAYQTTLSLEVRLVDKTPEAATGMKNAFLSSLGKRFIDPADYAIEVSAGTAKLITDKSILTSGTGYSVTITFTGGIYTTRQVPLLGDVVPEGEFIKEG
ncbi:hypothetical protein M7775_02050 [Sporomusa sphaeroides DSM 2875]|uniref:hypothetical protein n=1 Tax=Sporomusa sphaeroides TaxID=47679 RepID=UPI00202FBC19|nr:hypothetical protein [Sporomusa sphaeroides]MCM0757350.1 hypothetical protein [Sporomusa sphaeroides DSM 2875]